MTINLKEYQDKKVNELVTAISDLLPLVAENKQDYLGIKYEENDFPKTFYPDYIIQLKNGKILIVDTKSGNTAVEAKSRAEALYKYIKKENESDINLLGGIIVQQGKDWKVNLNEIYLYDKNDLTNWTFLDDII